MINFRYVNAIPASGIVWVPFYPENEEDIFDDLSIDTGLLRVSNKGGSITYHTDPAKRLQWRFISIPQDNGYKKVKEMIWKSSSHYFEDENNRLEPLQLYFPTGISDTHRDAILTGFALGTYRPNIHDADIEDDLEITVHISSEGQGTSASFLSQIAQSVEVQKRIMDLVNKPANILSPEALGRWALQSALKYGYSCEVLDKSWIQSQRMGAFLAVNRGSERDPVMLKLTYSNGDDTPMPTIGLVGKGVTFDAGGVSMKGAQNMHYMKSDMAGAAIVLGTVELVARLNLPINIIAYVPCTDNVVDASSILPGDVVTSYSGKTIEIIDTDAEGRLIMADAISYLLAQHKVDTILNIATLTGSAVRTFGYECGAVISSDQELVDLLQKAGEACGERLWPLPNWEEYKSNLASDIADIKNFSGKPVCGAIDAGMFIQQFTNAHPHWAHLDIAGVSFGNVPGMRDKAATGYGPRLLMSYFQSIIDNQ